MSNLEMVYSVREDVRRLQETAVPFCIRDVCEHPWIPVPVVGPSTSPCRHRGTTGPRFVYPLISGWTVVLLQL